MNDKDTTIEQLKALVTAFESERDWRQFHSPKNLAMGVAIEAGELMEHFQWLSEKASEEVVNDAKEIAEVRDEMADVFCYLLNMASVMGIDLTEAFRGKMARNAQKYPVEEYRGRY